MRRTVRICGTRRRGRKRSWAQCRPTGSEPCSDAWRPYDWRRSRSDVCRRLPLRAESGRVSRLWRGCWKSGTRASCGGTRLYGRVAELQGQGEQDRGEAAAVHRRLEEALRQLQVDVEDREMRVQQQARESQALREEALRRAQEELQQSVRTHQSKLE